MAQQMNDTVTAEVEQLRNAIEHAPRDPGRMAANLLAWTSPAGTVVCAVCAARIMARGCRLPVGSNPVWNDSVKVPATCCTCGSATFHLKQESRA